MRNTKSKTMQNTKSKTKKLLTLGRETVRALSSAELLQVAGAEQGPVPNPW